jgi:hypothetical protein
VVENTRPETFKQSLPALSVADFLPRKPFGGLALVACTHHQTAE